MVDNTFPPRYSTPRASSGGGGSSNNDKWENPYDELYNLTEQINEALRKREKLEREYQSILDNRTKTSDELRKNSLDQIAQLRKEIDLQKQLLEGRRKQLANIASEKYTDSEGNESTYSSLGVTRYASYNESTGLIEIDWAGINSITDPDKGGAIEAYISRLEEISSAIEDTEKTVEDMDDKLKEIKKRGIDKYLELEERVYQALVDQQQKIIDNYQNLSDEINDSNSKVIDNLREQIDLERQIRDNTKTEEEIRDKEARLAYLQRDTSGANAKEILELQKEIDEARQNYSDTLIDQAIDKLQKENDVAAEQRAQQIEIMQAQLDYAAENGEFWNQAYELMRAAFNDDGTLNNNSAMVQLLGESDAFRGMSYFGKQNWVEEMATQWKQAQEGEANLRVKDAQEKGRAVLGNGTELIYNSKTEEWADKEGSKYTDLNWNNRTGEYIATKVQSSNPSNPDDDDDRDPTNPAPTGESYPYGKASETSGNIKNGDSGTSVKAIQYALNKLGYGNSGTSSVDGIFGSNTEVAVRNFQSATGISADGIVGNNTRAQFKLKGYKTGGLADFTGPAWLDGTKTRPELVLNARDTENFIALRDVLESFNHHSDITNNTTTNGGDNYFDIDINVDEMGSDYDVDQLASEVRSQIVQDAMYRNVNAINFLR